MMDEEDVDDVFAALDDESFDSMDMEEGIQRDRLARFISEMSTLMSHVRSDQSDEVIKSSVESILNRLAGMEMKVDLMTDQRLAMLLDMLNVGHRPSVIKGVLKVVNEVRIIHL